MTEETKQLPQHQHKPLGHIIGASIGLLVATYVISFYAQTLVSWEVKDFIISDVVIIAFILALVWGWFIGRACLVMCSMHRPHLLENHKSVTQIAVWGITLALVWIVFLMVLKGYIVFNVMRFG